MCFAVGADQQDNSFARLFLTGIWRSFRQIQKVVVEIVTVFDAFRSQLIRVANAIFSKILIINR